MKYVRTFEVESWLEAQEIDDERDALFFQPDLDDFEAEPERVATKH